MNEIYMSMNRDKSMLSKVPEITVVFWITKILTTGMGEVFSDYLFQHIDPREIAAILGMLGLALSLIVQLSSRRYSPWLYWLAVVMVSVFGTMFADIVHVIFGVPYLASTAFFLVALALVFALWYASEKTLSIHSIRTRRREVFYWAVVLITFALGTALGDLTGSSDLGYLASGLLFAALFAVPALAYRFLGLNEVFAFWFAYVLTRPLGASFADWMGMPRGRGGLDLGTGPVSLVMTVVIVGLVAYLAASRKDLAGEPIAAPSAAASGEGPSA